MLGPSAMRSKVGARKGGTRLTGIKGEEMQSSPHPVDVHVGGRVRLRRTLMGLSQVKLAQMLGLTFQQIQKYEKGQNRIGCSRIYELSRVLDVPVSFFFDDIPGEKQGTSGGAPGVGEAAAAAYDNDALTKRETLEMVRAYYRIADPQVRKRMVELIKAVAKQQG